MQQIQPFKQPTNQQINTHSKFEDGFIGVYGVAQMEIVSNVKAKLVSHRPIW